MSRKRLFLGLGLALVVTGIAAQEPAEAPAKEHTNRLAKEKSPYLLQHAHNPVDWYPWGELAFAKAKKEDKPVFLSIGYATCHWCHVMERESFENEEVAAFLNEHFVAIKVDREERPDIDEIYMSAVQAMTGSGGWPLSVFMTPEAIPFAGGTYFPQPARFGRKSFLEVLRIIRDEWEQRREAIKTSGDAVSERLKQLTAKEEKPVGLTLRALQTGARQLALSFDPNAGGFSGGATKFPMPHHLSFLLRYHHRTGDAQALAMVTKTLDAIMERGLRDHLAGGFHRYSTDREWAIPHFEKMLYDQAGLVRAFVEAYQVTGDERYAAVARETVDFVLARMRSPGGAFTSAWDADSEGEEGKSYVWTLGDVRQHLGVHATLFAERYGVSNRGNWHEFPGKTQLHIAASIEHLAKAHERSPEEVERILAECRAKLLAARDARPQPLHDDKVLTDWNGLMIGAAAVAARGLGEPRYAAAATEAAEQVLGKLRAEGGLLHRYRDGEAGIDAMLEDYAFLTWGLLELFSATQDPRWIEEARRLADEMLTKLWDKKSGGFFLSRAELIVRPKPTYDGAIPSGNSVAALALIQLGHLTGERSYTDKGEATLKWYSNLIVHHGGTATTVALQALDALLGPMREVVVSGEGEAAEAMLAEVQGRFLPRTVLIHRPPGEAKALVAQVPYVADQVPGEDGPNAYVCERYACKAPVGTLDELKALLKVENVAPPK